MRARALLVTLALVCGLGAAPGEWTEPLDAAPLQEERQEKVKFQLREASLDALVGYLRDVTPWIIVETDAAREVVSSDKPRITAASDTEIPIEGVLDFVDTALRPHKLATIKIKNVVVIATEEEAKSKTHTIRVGKKPEEIEISDQVVTQIIPLTNVSVNDVNKELGDILKGAGKVSVNTHANVIVVSGRSQDIHRVVRILSVIDAQVNDQLKIRVITLQNADAAETAKILNEMFQKVQTSSDDGGGFLGNLARMFGGGRGRRPPGGSSGVQAQSLVGQTVRISADVRTNSVVVVASEDNMKLVEELVRQLDSEIDEATKVKMYTLQHADANEVARVVNELFQQQQQQSGGGQSRRGGPPWMRWMGGGGGGASTPQSRQVRAVAETRANAVIVTAHKSDFPVIDDLVFELDRQITDVVKVVIYPLENADAEDMSKILQQVFRNQIQASRQSVGGRQQGGQGGRQGVARMATGGSGLPPSEEVEITADTRTNSIVAKASEEYQAVIREVIKELDEDETEEMTTYTIPLRNADADEMAEVLRGLLKGGTRSTSSQNRTNPRTSARSSQQGRTQQGRANSNQSTRTRRLGPLPQEDGMDAGPAELLQEDPQDRRSVEGRVDVQADASTNSLVIRTSPRNFEAIERIIGDLDRMRPQVLIKVLIAEVTLTDDLQFGVEGFWENKMTVRGGDSATNRFSSDFSLPGQGFSYMLSGDEFEASLNMFAKDGRLRVLATPRILVLDNQTANINVGKEVPIITNTRITEQGNTINTVQYEGIGIMLEVTPQVNPDGLVTMAVHPEISDVASEAEAVEISEGVTNPTFIVNSADTTVTVRNGTTVVIGGLIRETTDKTVEKIPVLGDIPLLGMFFSNTTEKKRRRELMIFLTPYVAFTATDLEELTELEKSRLKLIDERFLESEGDVWLDRIRDH